MNENLSNDQSFFSHFADQANYYTISLPQNVLLCRICGKLLTQEEGLDIFAQSSDILEKIHFLLFIFVCPNDLQSKHICVTCYNHLECHKDFLHQSVPIENPSNPDMFENFDVMKEQKEEEIEVQNKRIYMLPEPIKQEMNVNRFSPENFDGTSPRPNPTPLVKQKDLHDFEDNSSSGDTPLFEKVTKCAFTCDVCNNFFISKEQLNQHTCIHALCDSLVCYICNSKFSRPLMYRKHIDVCQQNFLSEHNSILDSNQKSSGVFVCDICNTHFNGLSLLVKHQLKHKSKLEQTEKCNLCDLSFKRRTLLVRHMKMVHANGSSDSSPWKCRHCGKHMMTKLSLGIHERIHTGAKPYACEWCGQRFRSRANLLQHHPKHTGIKKHKCEECGKLFSRKSFVTAHMRVHTGERPYSCGVCERKFTQIGDMRRHEKKHGISIKHGKTCYTLIDMNKNLSPDSISSADSDDKLTDSEIALKVEVVHE